MELTLNQVTCIEVTGTKKAERQISVVRNASNAALVACLDVKGKAGKEIRHSAAQGGLVSVAMAARKGNYAPFAEMLAIRTGKPITISGRSAFESMSDRYADEVSLAKLGKNDGMTTDKKTGSLKPGAKLASAMELHNLCVQVREAVARIVAMEQNPELSVSE
jgi:hypothetical protein